MARHLESVERQQYFKRHYHHLLAQFGHLLTDLEKEILDLSFGISGVVFSGPEIVKRLNLPNQTQPAMIIRRALNKLRRAAVKESKASERYIS